MWCFMMSHLFRLTLVSFVQNSTSASTSFVIASFLFARTARAHCMLVPCLSCIHLLCPLLNIVQFVPMSWPIVVRLWVELETTILLTTFLALISSKPWPTFIPYQSSFMLSTISNAISYCFEFTSTSNIALFKMGCFKSFSMANYWYSRPFI